MAFGARVKEIRESKKITQEQLAEMVGWTSQALGTMERRDSNKSDYGLKIADALDVSFNWLMTGEGLSKKAHESTGSTKRYIPVRGTAQMGDGGYWEEVDFLGNGGEGYLESYNASDKAYAIRGIGQSMHPAIRSGWYIIFEPEKTPCPGEYVHVVLKNGRNMIKEFISNQAGLLSLISVNGSERLSFATDEVRTITAFTGIQPPSCLLEEIDILDTDNLEV